MIRLKPDSLISVHTDQYTSTFVDINSILFMLKLPFYRSGYKICFSEILKVNVFQDPYLNEITCTDPFQ